MGFMLTSDAELSGGVSDGDEFVPFSVVIDNHIHYIGTERNVVCADGERGGRSVRYLPVFSYRAKSGAVRLQGHTFVDMQS